MTWRLASLLGRRGGDYGTKDIHTTLRNLILKKDFKRNMYQHFQFTGEYSLTNS